MAYIFSVKDKSGRVIRLTEERWRHIAQEHPGLGDAEEIKRVLEEPLLIKESKYDPDFVRWYYRFSKDKRRYLLVAVKYLNGEGFVITAYYTRNIK